MMGDVVSIALPDGGCNDVRCVPTPVPGLVLAFVDGVVTVTHTRSGMTIGEFDNAEQAAAFVLHEVPAFGLDWTLSAEGIRSQCGPFLTGQRAALERHGGWMSGYSGAPSHPRFAS